MPKTEIDGDQIQDETVTGQDIQDDSLGMNDLSTAAKSDIQNQPFDNTGTDLTSTTIGDAIKEVASGNIPVDALTEYEAYSSPGLESTTDNGWVIKSGYPFTSEVKSAGRFMIDFTGLVGQSNANRDVGFRVEYREGTTGAWIELFSTLSKFPQANGQLTITSFREITLATDTEIQVQLSWGQTTGGGTGRLEQANIKIGKVAENTP
jgi:hypothetical protein